MFRTRFTKAAVSMLAVTLCSALLVVGCSDDDDGNAGGGFVSGASQEWFACEYQYGDVECWGMMFYANGEIWEVFQNGEDWEEEYDGQWSVLSDNRLLITSPWGNNIAYYNLINNNTLEFGYCYGNDDSDCNITTFTRRNSHRPAGNGGNLVLPSGQAWTDAHEYSRGNRDGIIFQSNGMYYDIDDYNGTWEIWGSGNYSTNGGILAIIEEDGGRYRMPYTVSDSYLYIGDWELVKTSNVTIGSSNANSTVVGADNNDEDFDSRLILPTGFAWVDDYPVGDRDGYIFRIDGTVQWIDDYSGHTNGIWVVYATGTWATSGNSRITMTFFEESMSDYYSVTNNTLILGGDYVLTRTQVGNITTMLGKSISDVSKSSLSRKHSFENEKRVRTTERRLSNNRQRRAMRGR